MYEVDYINNKKEIAIHNLMTIDDNYLNKVSLYSTQQHMVDNLEISVSKLSLLIN